MTNKEIFAIAIERLERCLLKLYRKDLQLDELTISELKVFFLKYSNKAFALRDFLRAVDKLEEENLFPLGACFAETENKLIQELIKSI